MQGYEQEEYTHLAVAAAVASGRADCGLGVMAAARSLDLDFVPLFEESYQLAIPTRFYESDLLRPLLDLMQNTGISQTGTRLPGYNPLQMGSIMAQFS